MFTNLLTWVHGQIESLQAQLGEKLRKIDEEGEKALADAAAKRRDEGAADENVGGDERAETRRQDEGRAARKKLEEEAVKPSIEELKEAAALVWIKYMHFVRRTEVSRSGVSHLDIADMRCCSGFATLPSDLRPRSQEPALHVAGVRG
jgi:cleavage stimulation factor subunit 3